VNDQNVQVIFAVIHFTSYSSVRVNRSFPKYRI
jgi:hypothetical protein